MLRMQQKARIMQQDYDASWFLAQFKPNSHNIAELNLTRQGFQTFLPMHEETRRTRGKFTTQMRPLFPGYLFVALDILKGGWRTVNSTYGVNRLVSLGTIPRPVPNALVEQLMQRCDSEGRLIPAREFASGDLVLMTKGPFADFVVTIESVSPDRRIWVLMDIIGRQTRVAVNPDHLQMV